MNQNLRVLQLRDFQHLRCHFCMVIPLARTEGGGHLSVRNSFQHSIHLSINLPQSYVLSAKIIWLQFNFSKYLIHSQVSVIENSFQHSIHPGMKLAIVIYCQQRSKHVYHTHCILSHTDTQTQQSWTHLVLIGSHLNTLKWTQMMLMAPILQRIQSQGT